MSRKRWQRGAGFMLFRRCRATDVPHSKLIVQWLLLRNGYHGGWGFPKGSRGANEYTALATAYRQLWDETGIRQEHVRVLKMPLELQQQHANGQAGGVSSATATVAAGSSSSSVGVGVRSRTSTNNYNHNSNTHNNYSHNNRNRSPMIVGTRRRSSCNSSSSSSSNSTTTKTPSVTTESSPTANQGSSASPPSSTFSSISVSQQQQQRELPALAWCTVQDWVVDVQYDLPPAPSQGGSALHIYPGPRRKQVAYIIAECTPAAPLAVPPSGSPSPLPPPLPLLMTGATSPVKLHNSMTPMGQGECQRQSQQQQHHQESKKRVYPTTSLLLPMMIATPAVRLSQEHSAFRWVDTTEAMRLLPPPLAHVLTDVAHKITQHPLLLHAEEGEEREMSSTGEKMEGGG